MPQLNTESMIQRERLLQLPIKTPRIQHVLALLNFCYVPQRILAAYTHTL